MAVVLGQQKFEFLLGFAELGSQLPEVVGEPLEDEHHNPLNGDTLQQTTTGLMVWRKVDNWTAFTDGYRSWVNGPIGLQVRRNDQLFKWETTGTAEGPTLPDGSATTGALLSDRLLVTWYGNPHTGAMGVLEQFAGEELARRL